MSLETSQPSLPLLLIIDSMISWLLPLLLGRYRYGVFGTETRLPDEGWKLGKGRR